MDFAKEAFNKNKALAQQCVNCENHAPCKLDHWVIVMSDGLNCDNFIGNIKIDEGDGYAG